MSAERWEPLAPPEVAVLLAGFPAPWWIAGGWALDLFAGRTLRHHEDVDISILRGDQHAVRTHLSGWDLQMAGGGKLQPWLERTPVDTGASLWTRRDFLGAWEAQFLLEAHDGDVWRYRRDPTISLPVAEIGLRSSQAIPYLRPEIVLLFKAKAPRTRDEQDFEAVLPALSDRARARLDGWLPGAHPWRRRL